MELESHTFVTSWGEFESTLEDVVSHTTLPMYGESNEMGVVLKEGDKEKLQCLTLLWQYGGF